MPTGYTAIILEQPGTTFREFATRCIRAFGVCVNMRDVSLDVPPPETIEPDPYYKTALDEAHARVNELEVMTSAQADECAAKEYAENVDFHAKIERVYAHDEALLSAMLAQVEAWEPPTPAHERFKEFMVQQIETSMPPDRKYRSQPILFTGAEWLDRRRREAAASLKRRAEEWANAQQCAKDDTEWLRALRASLPNREDPPR